MRQHAGDVLAVEQDAARVRRLEAGQHAQQRGLAAAARPEQSEELAGLDLERQMVDRHHATEAFGHPVDVQQWGGSRYRLRVDVGLVVQA